MTTNLLSGNNPDYTIHKLVTASIFLIHGCFRIYDGGVNGFGGYLESNGIPFGVLVAWGITLFEIVSFFMIMSGRYVKYFVLGLMVHQTTAIIILHFNEGWFVVGGGRNGMEYSVLILASLFSIWWNERK